MWEQDLAALLGEVLNGDAPPAAKEDLLATLGVNLAPAFTALGGFPPAVEQALVATAGRAGITPADAPAAVSQKIKRHFEKHPLPPGWVQRVQAVARAAAAEGQAAAGHHVLGTLPPQGLHQGPPPKGATPASPLARFALQKTAPSKRKGKK